MIVSVATVMPGIRASVSRRVRQAMVYQRWRPERSVAQQVVQQSLETWLARRRDGAQAGWVQALTWCGVPMPYSRQCAISAWYAYQIFANTEQKRSLSST